MTTMQLQILLAITFIYGVVKLLTHTRLFDLSLTNIIESVFGNHKTKKAYGWRYLLVLLIKLIDNGFFYFSLVFQAWWWLFRTAL